MLGLESIDKKTIAKQMEAAKLNVKVFVVLGIVLLAVGGWIAIDIIGRYESSINEEIKNLAKPFSFSLNEEATEQLAKKIRIDEEELIDFPIYLIDSTSLSRGTSLNVNLLSDIVAEQNQTNHISTEEEIIVENEDQTEIIAEPENWQIDENSDYFQEF